MAKVISEKIVEEASVEQPKMVEIKHTRVMQDANGNDVTVVDYTDVRTLDDAISSCETHKAGLETQLAEYEAELADYIAIRDAE